MAEIEFGGLKFSGGKMVAVLTALSTLGGAAWGGFEIYKDYMDMKEIIQNIDIDEIQSANALQLQKLEDAINEFKVNGKGDLATSHLIKEFVQLNKWKASKLLGKYNDNAQKLQLSNADNKPLIVKWSKD